MNNKLIIAASWESSRLKPFSNYIPKIMLFLWKKPAIVYMIDYWKKQWVEDILIILHSKYIPILQSYLKLFYEPEIIKHIQFFPKDDYLWSADAVFSAVKKFTDFQKNVIVSWSDIFPKEDINFKSIEESTCFLTNEGKCRYIYDSWNIIPQSENNGNVIWLYFLNSLTEYIDNYELWQDFVDIVNTFKNWISLDFIDFWDFEKWEYVKKYFNDGAREFNSLENIDNRFLFKKAINKKWLEVINQEISAYYKYYSYDNLKNVFPKIFSSFEKDSFFIEFIQWKEVRKIFSNLNYKNQIELVEKYEQILQKLHSNVDNSLSFEEKYEMCYEEYIWKIEKRINSISESIMWFSTITSVNWVEVISFEEVINKLKKWLEEYVKNVRFAVIHGDCTFSNSMLWDDGSLYLIDPRGKFWKLWVIGDINYDIAKFLYSSLTSYDRFNYDNFHISFINENEIIYRIPEYDSKIEDYLRKNFLSKDIQIILWIIWLWLAEYIKNDYLKMNGAYWEWMRQLSLIFNK